MVDDLSADEARYLNQKPSETGILFKQRLNVSAGFVSPKRRVILFKGIFLK